MKYRIKNTNLRKYKDLNTAVLGFFFVFFFFFKYSCVSYCQQNMGFVGPIACFVHHKLAHQPSTMST